MSWKGLINNVFSTKPANSTKNDDKKNQSPDSPKEKVDWVSQPNQFHMKVKAIQSPVGANNTQVSNKNRNKTPWYRSLRNRSWKNNVCNYNTNFAINDTIECNPYKSRLGYSHKYSISIIKSCITSTLDNGKNKNKKKSIRCALSDDYNDFIAAKIHCVDGRRDPKLPMQVIAMKLLNTKKDSNDKNVMRCWILSCKKPMVLHPDTNKSIVDLHYCQFNASNININNNNMNNINSLHNLNIHITWRIEIVSDIFRRKYLFSPNGKYLIVMTGGTTWISLPQLDNMNTITDGLNINIDKIAKTAQEKNNPGDDDDNNDDDGNNEVKERSDDHHVTAAQSKSKSKSKGTLNWKVLIENYVLEHEWNIVNYPNMFNGYFLDQKCFLYCDCWRWQDDNSNSSPTSSQDLFLCYLMSNKSKHIENDAFLFETMKMPLKYHDCNKTATYVCSGYGIGIFSAESCSKYIPDYCKVSLNNSITDEMEMETKLNYNYNYNNKNKHTGIYNCMWAVRIRTRSKNKNKHKKHKHKHKRGGKHKHNKHKSKNKDKNKNKHKNSKQELQSIDEIHDEQESKENKVVKDSLYLEPFGHNIHLESRLPLNWDEYLANNPQNGQILPRYHDTTSTKRPKAVKYWYICPNRKTTTILILDLPTGNVCLVKSCINIIILYFDCLVLILNIFRLIFLFCFVCFSFLA